MDRGPGHRHRVFCVLAKVILSSSVAQSRGSGKAGPTVHEIGNQLMTLLRAALEVIACP